MKKDKKKQKGVIQEFKQFITRGNVVDMAVGVIIGSAFTSIVTALTNSILMPLIGVILGGQADFKALRIQAGEPVYEADGMIAKDEFGQDLYSSSIYYGKFLQAIIDFLLIAIILFIDPCFWPFAINILLISLPDSNNSITAFLPSI